MDAKGIRPTRSACSLLSCGVLALACASQAARAESLSFEAAQDRARGQAASVRAGKALFDQREEERAGWSGVGGPSVTLSGSVVKYSGPLSFDGMSRNSIAGSPDFSLTSFSANFNPLVPNWPPSDSGSGSKDYSQMQVNFIWPLFTGGAARSWDAALGTRVVEAKADLAAHEQDLTQQVTQTYFKTQLAMQLLRLQEESLKALEARDQSVDVKTGATLNRAERLQLRMGIEAQRRALVRQKAEADTQLDQLGRLVRAQDVVQLSTPLFVITEPLPTPSRYVSLAMLLNPSVAKLQAQRQQAEHWQQLDAAANKPSVIAFAQREVKRHDGAWVVGVAARWTLLDPLDRHALERASRWRLVQVDQKAEQNRQDVTLAIEKYWRDADAARRQYLSSQTAEELAAELAQLRAQEWAEGKGRAREVLDAESQLLKARQERAQLALDYVMALSQLLRLSGQSESLPEYLAQADIRLK
ncbi:MAG: TolC family protein [Burkholderiaceae bacterium]|nr:MAG: TolC family protein [Burkholderiaceae bacterium]